MNSIAVYCGSQVPKNGDFLLAAEEFGRLMALKKITLVFGGYNQGLMGKVAEGAENANGRIIGVTIAKFAERGTTKEEWELHLADDLSHRRRKMMELADAFVALPGGFGTLDELTEVIVEGSLNMHNKPIGILNCANFYGPILDWRRGAFEEGLEDKERAARLDKRLVVKDNAADLLDGLLQTWADLHPAQ